MGYFPGSHSIYRPSYLSTLHLNEGRRTIRYDKGYVICYNPEEAKRDAEAREENIEGLKKKIAAQGIKGLVGNRGYARYLKVNRDAVEINEEAIAEEARYDGKYILKTNTDLEAAEAVLAYKQLWLVERAFRVLKSNLEIRPMYHWTESRIRGHIMVCFLVFYLEMVLRKWKCRCRVGCCTKTRVTTGSVVAHTFLSQETAGFTGGLKICCQTRVRTRCVDFER